MSSYHYPFHRVDLIADMKELLRYCANRYQHQPAFVYKNQSGDPLTTVTYEEFEQEVMAGSLGLAATMKIGWQQRGGKKIALIAPNSYEWTTFYLAVVNLGQIIVPMNPQLPAADLAQLLNQAGINAVAFAPSMADKIAQLKPLLHKVKYYFCWQPHQVASHSWVKMKRDGYALIPQQGDTWRQLHIYPAALCTLICTSGTTAAPKAVMLTHRTFIKNILGLCQLMDIDREIYLSLMPLYHIYEFECGLLAQLYRGSTIHYLPGGLHDLSIHLQQVRPTMLFLVPLVIEGAYQRICQLAASEQLDDLRVAAKQYFGGRLTKFCNGGAPLHPAVTMNFQQLGITALQGYGVTENSACVSFNRERANKPASVGIPLPNLKIAIDQPDTNGVGEILVRGPTVMLGYFKNDRQTDATITDNWLRTGDFGYFDNDGFLYVVGRKKNVILGKNATNIYPEDLESALQNMPGIKQALVYGKIVNDDVKPAALIVPDRTQLLQLQPAIANEIDSVMTQQFIDQQIVRLNKRNPKYKTIVAWELVDHLIHTESGKIKRT
jgi:long-chain acyl-CoA synthetase